MAFLPVLDKIQELTELITEPVMSRLILKGNRLLVFQVNSKGVKGAYGTMNLDVALFALNAAIRKAVRIF